METNVPHEENNARGGTGSKGNPVEIKRAIAEATKDLKRTGNDFEKIARDKEELLHDLAELRVHENEEVPSAIKKTIEKSIRAVQKRLKDINELLPEVDLSADQKKIHKIITEWRENKKILNNARRALARGEHKLAIDPADRRAMGDTNRAEATIYDANQKLDKLAQEATLIEENNTKNPVTEESVNIHTEQEIAKNSGEQQTEVIAPPQETQEPSSSNPPSSTPELPAQPENEGIHYTHEQTLIDQKEWEQKHKTSIEKIVESALSEMTHQDISGHTPAIQEHIIDQSHEIPETNTTDTPFAELPPAETPLLLDDGDTSPKEEAPKEKKEEIVIPVIIENDTHEDAKTEEAPAQPEEPSTPYETVPVTIKKESLPPSIERILNDHLDKLFGNKGFLGFGKMKGVQSRHWTDPHYGFSVKTIDEILNHRNTSEPIPQEAWGVQDEQERTKMRDYILQAANQTGITPNPEEKVVDYIKRVLELTTQKNNGQQ